VPRYFRCAQVELEVAGLDWLGWMWCGGSSGVGERATHQVLAAAATAGDQSTGRPIPQSTNSVNSRRL
jgi:hypothetical protein